MNDENKPSFFFHNSPKIFIELLHHICRPNVFLGDFLLPRKNPEQILEFFQTIQSHFYQSDIPQSIKWIVHSFSQRFSTSTFSDEDFHSLYIYFLNQINDSAVNDIIPYIKDRTKTIDSTNTKIIHNLGFFLLLFKESYPALYECLHSDIRRIIDSFDPTSLLKILGIPFFHLLSQCPTTAIENYDFEPHMIFDILDETCDPTILRSIQKRIVDLFPYPNDYPDVPNSAAQSYLNTCIRTNSHFFDVLAKLFYDNLQTFQLEKVPTLMRVFPIVVPYFLLAYQPLIYQNFDKYYRLIAAALPKSPAQKVQELMQKDFQIIELVNFLSGNEITINDLLEHTLPYHLQYVLHQKQLLEFQSFFGFVYNEKDWQTDYDFIYSYNIIRLMTELALINPSSQDILIVKLENLQMFLKLITNKQLLDKLTVDMFSFLFVQKDNQFCFTKTIANIILQILIRFNPNNNYFKMGQMSLQSQDKGDNLKEYFGLNRQSLLHLLLEEKWTDATILSEASELYWKDFILGTAMHSLCHSYMTPVACQEFQKEFNIEVGFSTYSIEDSLTFLRSEYPQFESLIDRRINTPKADILIPFSDRENWSNLMSVVRKITPSFILNSELEEESILIPQKSRHLISLIDNTKLFQKCFILSPKLSILTEDDSQEIPLNAINVLNGPIDSCSFELARHVASMIHVDLFEFVLSHLNDFNITTSFIEEFYKDHPIVCSALMMTQLSKAEISELPSEITSNYSIRYENEKDQKDNENENDLFRQAVDGLNDKTKSIEFFDDYLYRIDHSMFCDEILKRIGSISEETLLYLLDSVGYTMTDAQKKEYKFLFVKIEIQKVLKETSLIDSQIIFTKLIQMKKIQLLAEYIEFCNDSQFENIIEITKVLQVRKDIKLFLSFFPQYYIDLLKSGDENLISILLELRNDHQFISFAHLPKEIRTNSNINDSQSIVDAFSKRPELISNMNQDISNLLTDNDLIELLKMTPNSEMIYNYSHFKTIFKDRSILNDYLKNKIDGYLQNMIVNDIETEENVLKSLLEFDFFLNSINFSETGNTEFLKKLTNLIQFVGERPFMHTKIQYDFGHTNYSNLFTICLILDVDSSLAYSLCDMFNLDHLDFLLQRAYIPNSIYQLPIIQEMFQEYEGRYGSQSIDFTHFNFKDNPYDKSDLINNNSPFLLPYQKLSFFNSEVITIMLITGIDWLTPNASPAPLQIYQECQMSYKKNRKKPRVVNKKDVQTCLMFIRRYGSIESNLRMAVYFDDFENILPHLLMVDNTDQRDELFVNAVYATAVAINVYSQVYETFHIFRETEPLVDHLWAYLVDFLDRKEILYSLEFCYTEMKRFDDLGKVHIKLFSRQTDMMKKVFYIQNAHINFQKALQDQIELSNSQECIQLGNLTGLQKTIFEFVIENRLSNLKESIDIINDDEAAIYVGSLFMKFCNNQERRNELVNTIIDIKKVQMKKIIAKLCDSYKDAPVDQLKEFLKFKKEEPHYYEYYLEQLLRLISKSEKTFHLIHPLIYYGVKSNKLKVMLFIEYDFLVEAFTIVSSQPEEEDLSEYYPMIAHRASMLGIDELVLNCTKLMK